jgi:glycosyltransferase involved in cell wall biosynthesis/LmbE family N-acetylglucosaminyl deacetylase
MKISVIIPCHNAAKWVPFALKSVFAQTKKPFEVILVDDDSSDNLTEAIGGYAAVVKLIQVCKRNAAAARNEGIKAATGDWIALLDADDIWHENHLEWAEELLKSGKEVAYIANHDWIDLSGHPVFMPDWFVHPDRGTMRNLYPDDFFRLVSQGFHFCHSTVVYSRSLVASLGLFDEQQLRRHDLDLWLRVISNGNWAYDSRRSAGYREETPGSISRNELECDYFELLALRKFANRYNSKLFKAYFRRTARRALGIAITADDSQHFEAVYSLAAQDSGIFQWLFYSFAKPQIKLVSGIFKLKRKIQKKLRFDFFKKAAISIAKKLDAYYWKHIHFDVSSQHPISNLGSKTTSQIGFYADGVFYFQSNCLVPASAILEFTATPRLSGLFFDPSITAKRPGFATDEFYLRGSGGTQFLNVTSFLSSMSREKLTIQAEVKGLNISGKQARLHTSESKIRLDERVVVFGPHPDDCEIAAFGFYSDYHAKVVNITCGDATDRFMNLPAGLQISRAEIAKFRMLDSLYAPQIGGLCLADVANFCFPDGCLKEMFMHPERDFAFKLDYNFSSLREQVAGPLLGPTGKVSWDALVEDIRHSLRICRPTVIVCPHPRLDCHDDHFFTSLAIFEAIKVLNLIDLNFYFYSNHNVHTELWPFGPASSVFSPLPCFFKEGIAGDGFHFHPLNEQRRLQKAIALEAMHDIRDFNLFEPTPNYIKLRRIRTLVHSIIHRLGIPPTSYQRRGPRPYEFFITASRITGERILAEAAKLRGIKIEDSHS